MTRHYGFTSVYVRKLDEELNNGELKPWTPVIVHKPNLMTIPGRDYIHAQAYANTAAGGTGANKIGLSNEATPPDEDDDILIGELTTLGMARKVASPVPSHVAGTNVTVMEATWTASGTVNGIWKVGTFSLLGPPPAGVLVHTNTLDPVVNLVNTEQIRAIGTHNLG